MIAHGASGQSTLHKQMVRNNVHRLIWLDIASAVAVGVTTIVDEKFDLIVPLTGLALLFLLVLGGVNVVAIFLLWKKQPSRSFLPFAIYICCVVVMFYGVRLG